MIQLRMKIVGTLCAGAWLLLAETTRADTLYVVRRGWHIDVGFDAPELVAPLATVTTAFPGARYLLFGFGDRRFLMAKHSHVPAMLGAIWPGKALILVTGLAATPAEAFGKRAVVEIAVSPAQSAELQAFIVDSLQRASGSHPPSGPGAVTASFEVASPGPYDGSLFYSSGLKYSGFHTCNTWVAEGLSHAQLPVRSRGTLFAGQLWRQVLKLAPPPP